MRKILLLIFLLLNTVLLEAEVSVLSGVEQRQKPKQTIIPAPSILEIDDEMLPTSSALYVFEVCLIGKQANLVQAQQKPDQRASKSNVKHYTIKNYLPVRKCKDYIGADTPQDKRNMVNAALREIQVPNRESVYITMKASLGNPHGVFTVQDKALMPYTVSYKEMPVGSVLKKILVTPEKIKKFYNYNLPASIYLGSIIQKRFDNFLPFRISFYEEMLGNGQARNFIVFVFAENEKYTYTPAQNNTASETVYDISPDFAVQYLK